LSLQTLTNKCHGRTTGPSKAVARRVRIPGP